MIVYVNAQAGREGNGTREMPFKHINEAAKVAKPGDEVLVAPGIYREYVDPVNGGTEEQRIVYRSEVPLGAVITGETKHDEVVVAQSSRKIMDLGLEYNKPVGFGVTGPGMTELQAMDRIEKGREVVDAVVKMLQRLDY